MYETMIGSIGFAEFQEQQAELTRLGVNATTDVCLARLNVEGAKRLQNFKMVNKGHGAVTITMKKRGKEYTIAAEVITTLEVGATDRFKGPFAKRRVTAKSVIITDTNVGTPQKVEDTKGDGDLYQTDGPAGPAYPVKVGTINYFDGTIDFTFLIAVTAPVQVDYKHTDWTNFASSITFGLVVGGGGYLYEIYPEVSGRTDNWIDGIRDEKEIGWWGKKTSASQKDTSVGLLLQYFGDSSQITLPPKRGEQDNYVIVPDTIKR